MKRYLLLLIIPLLPGCTWLTGGDMQQIAMRVDQLDRSISVVNQSVADLKATSNDPNKYDEVDKVAADLGKLSSAFNSYVKDVNATNVSPAELIVTGTGIAGKAITPISPQAGLGLSMLSALAGVWLFGKKKED